MITFASGDKRNKRSGWYTKLPQTCRLFQLSRLRSCTQPIIGQRTRSVYPKEKSWSWEKRSDHWRSPDFGSLTIENVRDITGHGAFKSNESSVWNEHIWISTYLSSMFSSLSPHLSSRMICYRFSVHVVLVLFSRKRGWSALTFRYHLIPFTKCG